MKRVLGFFFLYLCNRIVMTDLEGTHQYVDENRDFESRRLERDNESEITESIRNDSGRGGFAGDGHDDWNIYQWRDEYDDEEGFCFYMLEWVSFFA